MDNNFLNNTTFLETWEIKEIRNFPSSRDKLFFKTHFWYISRLLNVEIIIPNIEVDSKCRNLDMSICQKMYRILIDQICLASFTNLLNINATQKIAFCFCVVISCQSPIIRKGWSHCWGQHLLYHLHQLLKRCTKTSMLCIIARESSPVYNTPNASFQTTHLAYETAKIAQNLAYYR